MVDLPTLWSVASKRIIGAVVRRAGVAIYITVDRAPSRIVNDVALKAERLSSTDWHVVIFDS